MDKIREINSIGNRTKLFLKTVMNILKVIRTDWTCEVRTCGWRKYIFKESINSYQQESS